MAKQTHYLIRPTRSRDIQGNPGFPLYPGILVPHGSSPQRTLIELVDSSGFRCSNQNPFKHFKASVPSTMTPLVFQNQGYYPERVPAYASQPEKDWKYYVYNQPYATTQETSIEPRTGKQAFRYVFLTYEFDWSKATKDGVPLIIFETELNHTWRPSSSWPFAPEPITFASSYWSNYPDSSSDRVGPFDGWIFEPGRFYHFGERPIPSIAEARLWPYRKMNVVGLEPPVEGELDVANAYTYAKRRMSASQHDFDATPGYAKAFNEAISGLRAVGTDPWGSLVELPELGDTFRTFGSLLKQDVSSTRINHVSDAYLSWKFGDRLAYADAKEYLSLASKHILTLSDPDARLWQTGRGHAEEEVGVLDTIVHRVHNCQISAGPPGNALARVLAGNYDLNVFTLENAWDLIPFSFVVDYFCNMGDFLQSISNVSFSELLEINYFMPSVLDTGPFPVRYRVGDTLIPMQSEYTWYHRHVAQTLDRAYAPLELGLPSLNQALTMSALLVSNLL